MAINTDETYAGSFPDRLGELGDIFLELRDIARTEGTLWTLFAALKDVLDGAITEAGDVKKEREIAALVMPIFDDLQEFISSNTGARLKNVGKLFQEAHVNRDTGQYEVPGSGKVAHTTVVPTARAAVDLGLERAINQEMRRQLADPPGTAPAVTVQTCTVSVAQSTGADNVGNGVLVLTTRRGDGLTSPFILPSKSRLACKLSGREAVGYRNHELFVWRDAQGVPKTHPDWGEGTRGVRLGDQNDVQLRVGDPTAFCKRGNLLANTFENFTAAGAPERWAVTGGAAGTDFRRGTTAYFGSYSLELIAGTGALSGFKQPFNDSRYSSEKLEGSTVYIVVARLRPPGTVTGGTLRFALTNSSGTVLANDQGVSQSSDVTLSSLASGAWTNFTEVFQTPKNLAATDEFRLYLTGALTGANVFIDGMILLKATRVYPGGWHMGLVAGSTPFASDKGRAIADYFDLTAANNHGGATQRRGTYQLLGQSVLDLDEHDTPWPESGTPDWPNSAIA